MRRVAARNFLLAGLGAAMACAAATSLATDPAYRAELAARGAAHFRSGDLANARAAWSAALESARAAGRREEAARFLIDLCRVDEGRGDYARALAEADDGARLAESAGARGIEARARNCRSLVERRLARYTEALASAQRALASARAAGDMAAEADALRNIGSVRQATGDYRAALSLYEESLQAARNAQDPLEEAKTRNDTGGLLVAQGRYAQAISQFGQSLALRQSLGDALGEARVLGNLCTAYHALGDLERALGNCRRAYDLARRSGDRGLRAGTTNNLAVVLRDRGDLRQAQDAYRESQAQKRELGDLAGEGRALNNLGDVAWRLGDRVQARADFERSLELKQRIGDRRGMAVTFLNLGLLALDEGRVSEAQDRFRTVLAIESEDAQPEVLWQAYDGLAKTHVASQRDLAILFGKHAVNEIQAIRSSIAEMDDTLQRSFLRGKVGVYRRLAAALIDSGRLPEARQVLDMLKEEEYFDFIRRDPAADPRTTTVAQTQSESAWDTRYRELTRDLAAKSDEYFQLAKRRSRGTLSPEESARLKALDDEFTAAQKAFRAFLAAIESEFASAGRAVEFAEKDLRSLHVLQGELEKLSRPAVLVHYFVAEKTLHILVTAANSKVVAVHREAPVGAVALARLVQEFLETLSDPGDDPRPAGKALHDVLIAPIAHDLAENSAATIMVSLDGVLRYVPLAALHDGSRYLVERYALVMYTPVAKVKLVAPHVPEWRVAGLGMSQAAEGFAALPSVPDELRRIVREGDADREGLLPGKRYLDGEFTRQSLEEVLHARKLGGTSYPIIHVASHFKFTPGTEEDSFLLLGGGARLTLADLRDVSFNDVQLLTLSACQTAVTGAGADGREIEGFAALAQQRGAAAVIATLWSVADASTATLMVDFYRRLREGGSSKGEALRRAQLALLAGPEPAASDAGAERGTVLVFGSDADRRRTAAPSYSHPYYWAPFVLMGNWL